MIKVYTAYTDEVDDIETAVAAIKKNIGLPDKSAENMIGFVACDPDFVNSGVLKAICDIFPFDILGTTTLWGAVPGDEGEMLLTLIVLTSDDVKFSTAFTGPAETADKALFAEAYKQAESKLANPPRLILSFAPLFSPFSVEGYIHAIDELSGNVPNFGTVAVDNTDDYHESSVIFNGETYKNRYAFVLLDGDINPRFYIASIPNIAISREKGVITASRGNLLYEVNNRPVAEYLANLGLVQDEDGAIKGINSFPFMLDYNDGAMPVVRVMFGFSPEGYAICGGDMPVGATLKVGHISPEIVRDTGKAMLDEVSAAEKSDCLLLFSCIGRYYNMGYEPDKEIKRVASALNENGVPYFVACSGSEICPTKYGEREDALRNRNHNDSVIACAF
jgi:hypothetical protein